MDTNNFLMLTDRDEFSDQLGRDLTDDEWMRAVLLLNRNKGMWQVIDEAIHDTVYSIENGEDV